MILLEEWVVKFLLGIYVTFIYITEIIIFTKSIDYAWHICEIELIQLSIPDYETIIP